jgi:tRNA G18 (ribose-2'-O)-methylase SpoU
MGAHEHVKWSYFQKIGACCDKHHFFFCEDLFVESLIEDLKSKGVLIVALETAQKSEMLHKFIFKIQVLCPFFDDLGGSSNSFIIF